MKYFQKTRILSDNYLSKFNIYYTNTERNEEAQLILDLKLGFQDTYFEKDF